MELNYSLNSLLGVLYKKGELCFSQSGLLLSPVGNRVTCFDIKNDKSRTFPFQTNYDLDHIALSPANNIMLAINEKGEGYLCSTLTNSVIGQHHFHFPISCVSFSPDGKYFAVCRDQLIMIYYNPSVERQVNQFYLYKAFNGATAEISHVDWTSDGRVIVAACRDRIVRVYACGKTRQLIVYRLSHHRRPVVAAYFLLNSLSLFTICEGGVLCMWKCDTNLEDLIFHEDTNDSVVVGVEPKHEPDNHKSDDNNEQADNDDEVNELEKEGEDKEEEEEENDDEKKQVKKILFKFSKTFRYFDVTTEKKLESDITCTAFHKTLNLLATGFTNGSFQLHWMPDFTAIHQLCISPDPITSLQFSPNGDWLAMGCSQHGQLAVWEWRSELFRYKGQSHCTAVSDLSDCAVTCVAYSADGLVVATGGQDQRVRLWRTLAGVCFRTFTDHQGIVTCVAFPSANSRVLFSASLDGTVRAMDLHRYVTFRTFTNSGKPVQFSSLSVDARGDLVAAGTQDEFSAFVWSVQTGKLLVSLSGHGGPVRQIQFSPYTAASASGPQLATGSWDKTVRLWDFLNSRDAKETIQFNAEVIAMAYRQDGLQLVVSTLNSELNFYNTITAELEHSIETQYDLGDYKLKGEQISAKQASLNKAFLSLCYTSTGCHLICGGASKYICIYNIAAEILVKRIKITANHSLAGVYEMLGRQNHVIERAGVENLLGLGQKGRDQIIPSERERRRFDGPEIKVTDLKYSPCGDGFAACTTEGLMLFTNNLFQNQEFSLPNKSDNNGTTTTTTMASAVYMTAADFVLDASVTPSAVEDALKNKQTAEALEMALKLSTFQVDLIEKVIESIPLDEVSYHIRQLGAHPSLLQALLSFLVRQLTNSSHLHFYLHWTDEILCQHAALLKHKAFQYEQKSIGSKNVSATTWSAHLIALQNPLKEKEKLLRRTVDWLDRTTLFLSQAPKENESEHASEGSGLDDSLMAMEVE